MRNFNEGYNRALFQELYLNSLYIWLMGLSLLLTNAAVRKESYYRLELQRLGGRIISLCNHDPHHLQISEQGDSLATSCTFATTDPNVTITLVAGESKGSNGMSVTNVAIEQVPNGLPTFSSDSNAWGAGVSETTDTNTLFADVEDLQDGRNVNSHGQGAYSTGLVYHGGSDQLVGDCLNIIDKSLDTLSRDTAQPITPLPVPALVAPSR